MKRARSRNVTGLVCVSAFKEYWLRLQVAVRRAACTGEGEAKDGE